MFEPVDPAEAARILATESGHDGDLGDVAALLGGEPPVLRWAAALARTMGWGPLRPRLLGWTLPDTRLPWRDDVASAVAELPAADAELLALLAACDAPFAWDVLESVAPGASIESVVRLEELALLRRSTHDGVVTFLVPYSVRAFHHLAGAVDGASWLEAWVKRAEELRPSSYGPRSRATLSELAAAVPLAARALFATDEPTRQRGLALWNAASDALFFGDAIAFDAPAFARAVEIADAGADLTARVRVRIVGGRALLERGDAAAASALLREALSIDETGAARRVAPSIDEAGAARRVALSIDEASAARREAPSIDEAGAARGEVLRGAGWAALALTDFDRARAVFDEARALAVEDPRGQADATAGLGILALLGGDPSAARALLEEAVAIHVVMRDAPRESAVRGMMELLPEARAAAADVARIGAQVEEFRSSGQRWREALALARLAIAARTRGDTADERTRLHEARAAAMLARMPAESVVRALVEASEAGTGTPARPFIVGADGRSLTLPSGETHDLARHGPVRRILWALADARSERPGTAMSTLAMIEAGWPGEKMQHEAATLRVYTTIRRLRALGLADALLTRDEGYLLDPETAIRLERG